MRKLMKPTRTLLAIGVATAALLGLLASEASAASVLVPTSAGDGLTLEQFAASSAANGTKCQGYSRLWHHAVGLKDAVTGQIQWVFHFDITVTGDSSCSWGISKSVYVTSVTSGWVYRGVVDGGSTQSPDNKYLIDVSRVGEFDVDPLPPACEPCNRLTPLGYYPLITWQVDTRTGQATASDSNEPGPSEHFNP